MTHLATDILRQHAANAANNAPLHEQQGDYAQAALDREVAEQCEQVADFTRIVSDTLGGRSVELMKAAGNEGQ